MVCGHWCRRQNRQHRACASLPPRRRSEFAVVGAGLVAADGTFVARLDPGAYQLALPQDSRSAAVVVPRGKCLDLVLDFRLPMVVLEIPGEGWPVPTPIK